MKKIFVNGGRPLCGVVTVGGSKNAALPVLFGGILTDDVCVFAGLPRVGDVLQALEILRYLGARIHFQGNGEVSIDYRPVRPRMPPVELTGAIRGSTYLLGALLGRFGCAELGGAGGCDFGARPIDQHLFGFSCLGADCRTDAAGVVRLTAPDGLHGASVPLAMPSVGASANLLLAASRAEGETVISNAAAEPHVAALAAFLTDAGADIAGVPGPVVRVRGVPRLHGCRCTVIPDMIEAGTYLSLGLACGGPVRVKRVVPAHLGALLDTFRAMGASVRVGEDFAEAAAPHGYRGVAVTTGPYPAFPTDLHPQLAALFCLGGICSGDGEVTETVFRSRFRYTEELRRMGASPVVEGARVRLTPQPLHAALVAAPDLRGGAALLLAALATPGRSEIVNAALIGRGYEHLGEKLRGLGASVSVL